MSRDDDSARPAGEAGDDDARDDHAWRYAPARDIDLTPSQRYRSERREAGLITWLTSRFWWACCGTYLRRRHRLRVIGREHLPRRAPFVIVANHASHLDALAIAAALPRGARDRLLPLAAGDTFFATPATAFLSSLTLNALPMWREHAGRHALANLRARLTDEPCGFILFPEGTRSRDGAMAPFKPGVGMIVAGSAVPVTPVHLEGTFEAWPPDQRRPHAAPVTIRVGRTRTFEDAPNRRAGWQAIASELEAAVRELAGAAGGP